MPSWPVSSNTPHITVQRGMIIHGKKKDRTSLWFGLFLFEESVGMILVYPHILIQSHWGRCSMNRLIGFILFWTGVGMIVKCILPTRLSVVLVAVVFVILGYNLFCRC